ncbi:MAG: tRNA (adenosine(37)-N6)-dimethylallyltransferase MiaA [Phycisphaerales bacterium]|nr:MAG: tRNA (adenosine(37)-N6)-dimethylallyltransferase MiaA [Phycisphaerales bacterium]
MSKADRFDPHGRSRSPEKLRPRRAPRFRGTRHVPRWGRGSARPIASRVPTTPPHRFPIIAGPTAGGKSALGVAVALELERRGLPRGEVVSADAFQVYRGLDIASAKPTEAERRGVRHHLIDAVEPTEAFALADWLRLAEGAIAEIRARGVTPIVVGGTHLYVKSLLDGFMGGPGADEAIRDELRAMDPALRRAELERVDPAAAARIHPNDERRTVRALEVYRLTGQPITAQQGQWDAEATRPRDRFLVGLEWGVEAINRRINARVRAMVEGGLVDETRRLLERDALGPQARQALGTKQLLPVLEGLDPGQPPSPARLEDAIERIKIETRRFAKSQRTWLRRLRQTPGAVWIQAEIGDAEQWAQHVVNTCFKPIDKPASAGVPAHGDGAKPGASVEGNTGDEDQPGGSGSA